MLTNDEIAAFIESGYEVRAVEFKGPGSVRDPEFVAKVARAVISLANQRDGGWVIVGVDEADPERSGLSEAQLAGWMDYDTVVDKINRYADPPVRLGRDRRQLPTGEDVVVLEVAEFDEVPVLAATDSPKNVIRRGYLYTRSKRKPESTPTHTQNELREVLDLATQKQLRRFLQTARGAGLDVAGPTDLDRYVQETEAVLVSIGVDDVAQLPRFEYAICPLTYEEERVEYTSLVPAVRTATVSARGWPYPFVERPELGERWVSERNQFMHREVWAAFESGQFASWHQLPADVGPDWSNRSVAEEPAGYFPVWLPVAQFTEVFSFAARYRQAIGLSGPMTVRLRLVGAKGWLLVAGDPRRGPFHGEYRLGTNLWERSVTVPDEPDGVLNARQLAAAPSMHLLRRFGWSGVSESIIESAQHSAFGDRTL